MRIKASIAFSDKITVETMATIQREEAIKFL